jgi:hypothetical protein
MAYRIRGVPRASFEHLFGMTDEELRTQGARRVQAAGPGYPCRISLEEAAPGESLILLSHVSHDVATPFRTAYAIFVREQADEAPAYVDQVPELLARRTLGLRGFDREGMLRGGLLAVPGEADARIGELFADPAVASIHAHNAALGCFLAKVERD